MGKSEVGASAESLAKAWFLSEGYEVFSNVSPSGPVDMVTIDKGGQIRCWDVKGSRVSSAGFVHINRSLSKRSREAHQKREISLLFVFIGPRFEVVISEDEEDFIKKVTDLGFKTHSDKKAMTKYTLYNRHEKKKIIVQGITDMHVLFGKAETDKILYHNTSEVWVLESKEKILVPKTP